jgi:hypothetical protein
MNPLGSRPPDELEAAVGLIHATAAAVAERVCLALAAQSQSASKALDRNVMFAAQLALHRNLGVFQARFSQRLDERMRQTLATRDDTRRSADTDWASLSLVDDSAVEEQMASDRFGQQINHACDNELRELAGYLARITGPGDGDRDRNPLRPLIIGEATYSAIEAVCEDVDERRVLAREFGAAMAQGMVACYAAIVADLKSRGLTPVTLAPRSVETLGKQRAGGHSGYGDLRSEAGQPRTGNSDFQTSKRDALASHQRHGHDATGQGADSGDSGSGSGTGPRDEAVGTGVAAADGQLMSLLRRLTQLASQPANRGHAASWRGGPAAAGQSSPVDPDATHASASAGHMMPTDEDALRPPADDAAAGLMAVNLIRVHREELMQASPGKLDHMVIDVVGSLFDQILSDTRVPPQMARQIARLQLPVLRVALVDASFFSSRRHPVRRLINRIASLSCAFDDFEGGPGREFVERVQALVQDIIEGDFDQVELYASKLDELEGFTATQATSSDQHVGAIAVLQAKESDLRVQQRYLAHLRGLLSAIPVPEFLRDFICQVWSQALVQASRQHGPQSETTRRLQHVARELVMSVQPKGSLAMRKRFLMQLPGLMRGLNEGMHLIGWPEPAQKDFLAQLLPLHAESLKVPAMTELDYNLMSKQLESIFNSGIPAPTEPSRFDAALLSTDIEQRFSPEEAKQVGLLEDQAVDWSGHIDIDLSDEPAPAPLKPLNLGVDINLDLVGADPAEPSSGASLVDHLHIGFAYQMLIQEQWQKVRLTYVSPGRSFFVFTHGRNLQETVSLTARMLLRMCEAQRLRALESSYLLERATSRTRKQLAELVTTMQ